MFEIKKYSPADRTAWDQFVKTSKNGTFLFERAYMDYHSDRFTDFSLLIFRKGRLYALLPANRVADTLHSHQGLTYGGFVMNDRATVSDVLEMFGAVNLFLRQNGFSKVVYKAIPYIYDRIPAQEDLYALFRAGATQIAGNISSAIYSEDRLKFTESRKSGLRKARAAGLRVTESDDLATFWNILSTNLEDKYSVKPVHTLAEISLLKSRFPKHIKLYLCLHEDTPLGGTLVYETGRVVHTQYISANLAGKNSGALDLLFDYLINKKYADIQIFDVGQSTENSGYILNENLIFQKEGFGGRGVMYNVYEYTIE